jgi:hypothetical protein
MNNIIKSVLATIGTVIAIGLILFAIIMWWMVVVLIICSVIISVGTVWIFMFFRLEVFNDD